MPRHLFVKPLAEPPDAADGWRVLVERLWPAGLDRAGPPIDHWLREAAPSPYLWAWFGGAPERFAEFASRYTTELRALPDATLHPLRERLRVLKNVTLLHATGSSAQNHAEVLAAFLAPPRGFTDFSRRGRET